MFNLDIHRAQGIQHIEAIVTIAVQQCLDVIDTTTQLKHTNWI